MIAKPADRCHIDKSNETAHLCLISWAYHRAVDRDKSGTAKEVKYVGTTGGGGEDDCRPGDSR